VQTVVQSLVILLASIAIALAGVVIVRRSARIAGLAPHNDVAGVAYLILGTVYAFLLAFVCVLAWQRFELARTDALREAGTIISLHELAQGLSPDGRQQIDAGLLQYTQSVVDDEWNRMASGQGSAGTERSISGLWQRYHSLSASDRQDADYLQSLTQMGTLEDVRGIRLEAATGQAPRVLWVFLVAGALLTVAFAYLLIVQNFWSQILITGALTLTIVGVLILVYFMDNPYRGTIRVEPDSLRAVEQVLGR
jgi:hypothetical protein